MNREKTKSRILAVSARGLRFALVVSQFNKAVTTKLLQGAQECLRNHGVAKGNIAVYSCPGSFELPQVANVLVTSARWDAVVCLGAVIRGETPHFEYVAAETARGIQQVALRSRTPVVFGVLTTNTVQQAYDRAGGKQGNKGWDAALAAIDMAVLFKRLKEGRATG